MAKDDCEYITVSSVLVVDEKLGSDTMNQKTKEEGSFVLRIPISKKISKANSNDEGGKSSVIWNREHRSDDLMFTRKISESIATRVRDKLRSMLETTFESLNSIFGVSRSVFEILRRILTDLLSIICGGRDESKGRAQFRDMDEFDEYWE